MPSPRVSKPAPLGQGIVIRGARQNNLRGFDVEIPLGKLCVVTGPSGSGKSSLAFDTVYAEGQRRYVETFSPYTRQFFERMDKPQVDAIEGIPPAIAIEQVNQVRSSRSTVGTITEINDYLKQLFPRLATAYCPRCAKVIAPHSAASVQQELLRDHVGETAVICFPVPAPGSLPPDQWSAMLQSQGFLRLWHGDAVMEVDEALAAMGKTLPAMLLVVQDRVKLAPAQRGRLSEALESAMRLGKGQVTVAVGGQLLRRSTQWLCLDCDFSLTAPTAGLFSFNNPIGACPKCRGFGRTLGLDLRKAMPDESLSLKQGVIKAFSGSTYRESQQDLLHAAKKRGVNVDCAFAELSAADRRWVIEGEHSDPETAWQGGLWYGVRGFFKWLESKAYKMHVRVFLSRYRAYTVCGDCDGGRLKPEAHCFRIGAHGLAQLWQLPVDDLLLLVRSWSVPAADQAALLLRDEIASRLEYLQRAGLGYLHLDRQTRTLSGGELQRVNLTTCLGASLVNTLFVLDEPSIGLHPRDIGRLIGVMQGLRDKGNTLLVVEHEESVMRSADHVLELGPGRGAKGGDLVHSGPLDTLYACRNSLTADYLTGRKSVPKPAQRRPLRGKSRGAAAALQLRGVNHNNLRGLDVDIPLGLFCCVTGVSGSGKSSLIHEVLHRQLQRLRGEVCEDEPGELRRLDGHQGLREVVMVDQSPLARTPRSTPAVYLGVFDVIRQLFADSADGRAAGISAGFFSFNSGEGRCERCWGTGSERIEMQFLSDLFVTCPECLGRRYQAHALKIRLEGRNIHEVLGLTLEQAAEFFSAPAFAGQRKLAQAVAAMQIMVEAGLGYLTLGQPLNTLSGGEAQRLKLVGHLLELQGGAAQGGDSLLLLDEPTTGLHFDDIAMLVKLLQRLVDGGCSLVVIEHNLEVIACADWIIDLGPEGGNQGGQLVICGTPEQVEQCDASHTGRHLRLQRGQAQGLVQDRPAAIRAAAEISPVISICGAREHNLKNISLDIPRQQMVVVTGLSGSGKSSLAFDLVFAEGQRRFLDSMSVYARSFVEQMERPQVDRITGVPPTVAIEQRVSRGGGKSTVATVTEIWHFMRLLFSKLGVQHCPQCAVPVESQSVTAITASLEKAARRGALELLAPLIKGRKGFHTEVAEAAARQGVEQLWVDGKWMATEGFKPLARFKEHQIDALVARVPRGASALLLRPLVEKALKMGRGALKWRQGSIERVQSTQMSCPQCETSFEALDPRLFSFNSPHGWCRHCRGFGVEVGAAPSGKPDASALEVELEEERRVARRGEEDEDAVGGMQRRVCGHCAGSRLNEVARAVHLPLSRAGSVRIEEVHGMAAADAAQWLGRLRFAGREAQIARDILLEIRQRLKFMQEVGLGYLQLCRSADTLSGGEAQRIRLAAQLGSNLRGVLYVLDEPTIGLHPRDNQRLLSTLQSLRDKGNSLLVVEHDEDTMRCADQIIDLGPGAGRLGGEVLAQGSLQQLMRDERSVTGRSLASPISHPMQGKRRSLPAKAAKEGWMRVQGACANNLKNMDLALPVGRLSVITGVSGSGKSTLMHQVLLPAARQALQRAKAKRTSASPWKQVSGFDQVAAVHEVNQSPIGKTSRSCPATYVGVLDEIRRLYAQLPAARARGFDAGRFSFNNDAGRCEACQGNGEIKVEMNFLPTTRMPCETCGGLRFNAATLEVEYQGRSMGQVLAMSIAEAAEFFAAQPRIAGPLRLLAEMGVGYLQLGQPSPTLSGGEAQRLKLVTELSSGQSRHVAARLRGLGSVKGNLYLIEEPTIGLHLDDVKRLLEVLHRLVDEGHSVVVIEHHPALFAEADYLLDLGPEAGAEGGRLMACGTPEQVAASRRSVTAPFLREALEAGRKPTRRRQKAH